MVQSVRRNNHCDAYAAYYRNQRQLLLKSILHERSKLESMVAECIQKEGRNLGADLRILAQSRMVDKLIVDEMMLEDLLSRQRHKEE